MFIFSTCQIGVESVLKKEITHKFPAMRTAFARPGFVSFKTENPMLTNFAEHSVFARSAANSLGKIEIKNESERPQRSQQVGSTAWQWTAEHHLFINRVHVFSRDSFPIGEQNFEPHVAEELVSLHRQIIDQSPTTKFLGKGAEDIFHPALTGETVLDIVQVDPNLYLVGTHVVTESSPIHSRYSGGIVPITLPEEAVSRAYLKFNEGFLWSGIVPDNGCSWLDIGASPGGCSQFLLKQGFRVFGVDPAEIHPAVLSQPKFTHCRCRIKNLKQSVLKEIQWIAADMNVAPNYTLDVLEDILTKTSARGLLFTLKLLRWELADTLPMLLERLKTWGFPDVRMKQLTFNRQEVMVAVKR